MTYESEPKNDCCESCVIPIESCHREDIAGFEYARGANLFCCACGRFWQGTEEERAAAIKAEEDYYDSELSED